MQGALTETVDLLAARSRQAVTEALDRATRFRRFKASDARAIIEGG